MYKAFTYWHVKLQPRIAGEKFPFVISLCAFFRSDSTGETIAILAYTFNLN